MGKIIAGKHLNIDFCDVNAVIGLAKMMGGGQTVYKNPTRPNYNICHTVNENRLDVDPSWVVFRT